MSISIYDPTQWNKNIPANVLGGIHRAQQARRDKYGRFQPVSYDLPEPDAHGKSGGMARANHAKRDNKGRFTK